MLNLEEVEIDFDYLEESEQRPSRPEYDEKYGTTDTISTNSPNFSFLLANFGPQIFRPSPDDEADVDDENSDDVDAKMRSDGKTAKVAMTERDFATRVYKQASLYAPDEDIEARIEKYVSLIVRYVKKLRRLSLFITAPFGIDVEEDTAAWNRLLELEHLEELEVRYARYGNTGILQLLSPEIGVP